MHEERRQRRGVVACTHALQVVGGDNDKEEGEGEGEGGERGLEEEGCGEERGGGDEKRVIPLVIHHIWLGARRRPTDQNSKPEALIPNPYALIPKP